MDYSIVMEKKINGKNHKVLKCELCGKISKPIRNDRIKNFICKCDYVEVSIGDIFYDLKVLDILGQKETKHGRSRKYALCECVCGNRIEVRVDHLRSGNSRTCGKCKTVLTENPHLFNRASNILQRCNNPFNSSYKSYGALGIKCNLGTNIKEVVTSLLKIPGYVDGYEIDRVDPFKDYTIIHETHKCNIWYSDDFPDFPCLGNLRWVPSRINKLNKKQIKILFKEYNVMYSSKNNYLPHIVDDFIEFCGGHINMFKVDDFLNSKHMPLIFSTNFKNKFKEELNIQRLFLKRK